MQLNVEKELAALRRMTVAELRQRYAQVFGEMTKARHKDYLRKRIIWRLQANAEGDLSERARRRAAELANDADLRRTPPKAPKLAISERTKTLPAPDFGDRRLPMPGTVITREYKGRTLHVTVRQGGFEYEGEVFKSLSAVAKAITGSHCNGYLFFRLPKNGGSK